MVYYLPITGPSNYTVSIDGRDYALKFEQPDLPLATIGGGECKTTGVATYPNWPQTDWSGKPSHADKGDKLIHNGVLYTANWWTKSTPGSDDSWAKECTISP
jgi:chitinase